MSKKEKLLERMLAKPPDVTFAEFESFMEMHGWIKDRQKGSHAIFIRHAYCTPETRQNGQENIHCPCPETAGIGELNEKAYS